MNRAPSKVFPVGFQALVLEARHNLNLARHIHVEQDRGKQCVQETWDRSRTRILLAALRGQWLTQHDLISRVPLASVLQTGFNYPLSICELTAIPEYWDGIWKTF